MTDFKNIGPALRWLRGQRGQKQREVAQAAGITPAMLSAYETGKHRPSLDTTERVLAALECDVVDLTNALRYAVDSNLLRKSDDSTNGNGHGKKAVGGAGSFPLPQEALSFEGRFEVKDLSPEEAQLVTSLLPGLVQLIRFLKPA